MLRDILKEAYVKLSRDEILALVTAHQEGQITNSRLQILSQKHSHEVGKILTSLVYKGMLISDGQRRGMRYFLSDIFIENAHIFEDNSVNSEDNSINNEDNSINSGQCFENIDGETMNILKEISKEAREKKRLDDIGKMKDIIFNLCEIKPLALKELASLLSRNPVGIRNNYLSPLIDEGKIRLMYPGQINHPQQAYIAIRDDA